MKILYLRTNYWFNLKAGGSVGHTAGVINGLQKKTNLTVVSNDTLPEIKIDIEVIKPIFIPGLPKGFSELFYSLKVIKRIKKRHFDVIYQRYNGFSFCGAYLARKNKTPLILEFNSSSLWKIKHWQSSDYLLIKWIKKLYNIIIKLPLVRAVENYNLKNSTLIVVVSNVLKDSLVNQGLDENRILVNPNGISEDNYSPEIKAVDIINEYNFKNKTVIGFIGTFGQWHGTENLVSSFGKLIQNHPEYRKCLALLMIGDGLRMKEVKALINKYQIEDIVTLTGVVPQSEGPRYLSVCDILVNATVPNPDGSKFFGSPTKLFEYMAMGKGIISSDMDQMSEILEHNRTAILVKPGDIQDLMHGIKTLVDNEKLRNEIGQNAREVVVTKYTWDIHVKRILDKLEDVKN